VLLAGKIEDPLEKHDPQEGMPVSMRMSWRMTNRAIASILLGQWLMRAIVAPGERSGQRPADQG